MLGFLKDFMYQDEALRLTWLDIQSEHMLEINNGRRTGPWQYEWRQLTEDEVKDMEFGFGLSEMGIGPGDWMVRGICEAEQVVREDQDGSKQELDQDAERSGLDVRGGEAEQGS